MITEPTTTPTTRGTLKISEPHPAAYYAKDWIEGYILGDFKDYCMTKESLASCAIENNRTAEIVLETLQRLEKKENVSDRYLLGAAWLLRDIRDEREAMKQSATDTIPATTLSQ